jgi:predicted RNA-binding protein Jag
VGPEGKTLESLQFLVTLMLSRSLGGPVAAQVDALGYCEKREKEMLAIA